MLAAMVQTLLSVFEAHRCAACLKTLAVAVEFFGEEADATGLLEYALTRSCDAAAPVYKVTPVLVMLAIHNPQCWPWHDHNSVGIHLLAEHTPALI